jgi:hypothetical protein
MIARLDLCLSSVCAIKLFDEIQSRWEERMEQEEALREIAGRLQNSIDEHKTFVDGFWYNTLTALSLVFSGFAAAFARDSSFGAAVSAASAGAALCIALERALGLGARWRFHAEMRSAYRTLQDGISFYTVLPPERKVAFLNDWWARLLAMRSREGQIPNSGGGDSK